MPVSATRRKAALELGRVPEHRLGGDAQRHRRERGHRVLLQVQPLRLVQPQPRRPERLLLSVAGQPLLVKAGWYDWYGSPQWTDWYHQTRSQNAITFDGGKGQLVSGYREQLQRNGSIVQFSPAGL
jgi:hypothetical protein